MTWWPRIVVDIWQGALVAIVFVLAPWGGVVLGWPGPSALFGPRLLTVVVLVPVLLWVTWPRTRGRRR